MSVIGITVRILRAHARAPVSNLELDPDFHDLRARES